MKIELQKIRIADIIEGYSNKGENGVRAYNGKLNVRPAFQREFIYQLNQQISVIETVMNQFPLNSMYWVENGDGTFELLDGQQRTMSICEFAIGNFSVSTSRSETIYFHNFLDDERQRFLDYELMVYICKGNQEERLQWFKTINIAGEKLTDQELLNINYIGKWLSDAKLKFSKTNCAAQNIADKFVNGSPIRQEYLETALSWISNGTIADYMARHQHDPNANELWLYFQSVIEWVKTTFRTEHNYRREMKGLNWGSLYNRYHENIYDFDEIEKRVNELMGNEEVTDKKGVYEYILSGEDENLACKLSKRTFSEIDKRTAYERQNGICPITGEKLDIKDMEADHIIPWWKGGTTTLNNLQMISKVANARKGGKEK